MFIDRLGIAVAVSTAVIILALLIGTACNDDEPGNRLPPLATSTTSTTVLDA